MGRRLRSALASTTNASTTNASATNYLSGFLDTAPPLEQDINCREGDGNAPIDARNL